MVSRVNRFQQRVPNLDLTIYEKQAGVGGTWYANRYPGLACDIPSHCVSVQSTHSIRYFYYFGFLVAEICSGWRELTSYSISSLSKRTWVVWLFVWKEIRSIELTVRCVLTHSIRLGYDASYHMNLIRQTSPQLHRNTIYTVPMVLFLRPRTRDSGIPQQRGREIQAHEIHTTSTRARRCEVGRRTS